MKGFRVVEFTGTVYFSYRPFALYGECITELLMPTHISSASWPSSEVSQLIQGHQPFGFIPERVVPDSFSPPSGPGPMPMRSSFPVAVKSFF